MPGGVNDPNDFEGRYQRQLDLVDNLENERDATAIRKWAATFACARNTGTNRLNTIRLLSERADRALVDFESEDDVYSLLSSFADGSHPDVPDDGFAKSTLNEYRKNARIFFRDQLDREWAEDITVPSTTTSPIGPEDVLTSEELDALYEASTEPRDTALVAFLAVTGQRITATLSIRVGDVDLSGRAGRVHLNADAIGLKGASGPRPLLWARGPLSNWLESHPDRHDPEAPLFCVTQSGRRPTEDGGWVSWSECDALSRSQAARRLRKLADRAGVPTGKVKPHNFRHTAITRMRREGVPDPRIKFMVGVAPDSDILERYDHATNEEMIDGLREHYGLADEDDGPVIGRPQPEECSTCGNAVRGGAEYCDSCGEPMTVTAADAVSVANERTTERMVDEDDRGNRLLLNYMFEQMQDAPPEVKREFHEEFASSWES